MASRIVIGGTEFEGEEAASIIRGTEALAAAISKVAEAIDGVKKELGAMGQKNALFYAEILRASKIAEVFAGDEIRPIYRVSSDHYTDIKNAIRSVRKIDTLKAIRAATGIGLAEAKDLVWKYWDLWNATESLMRHFKVEF